MKIGLLHSVLYSLLLKKLVRLLIWLLRIILGTSASYQATNVKRLYLDTQLLSSFEAFYHTPTAFNRYIVNLMGEILIL